MMRLCADCVLAIGIEDHDIGIAAGCNRTLSWIQTEQLGRCSRNQFHEPVHAEATFSDTAGEDQAHTMFYTRPAVWNFRKVVFAEFLLLLEAEGTVICGDNLQMVPLQSIPQFFLMPFFAKRGSEYVLRPFKTRDVKILD